MSYSTKSRFDYGCDVLVNFSLWRDFHGVPFLLLPKATEPQILHKTGNIFQAEQGMQWMQSLGQFSYPDG